MSKWRAAILLFSLGLLLSGCVRESPLSPEEGVYQKLTPQEAYAMLEEGEECILLDVRTQEEYEEARIEGALLLPDYEVSARAAEVLPDQTAVILVYCRSGRRSALAAKQLIQLGYQNVYDFGGILDWPYATVSGPAAP